MKTGNNADNWSGSNVFNGITTITNSSTSQITWEGNNTFNGNFTLTNDSNGRIILANSNGDTYNSTSAFINNGNNFIDISFNGTNTFAESITINNTAAGEIRFGEAGGSSTLTTGGLITTDFSVGDMLEINNFTQIQNVPNGVFGVTTFNSFNSSFQGDFQVTAVTTISFTGANSYLRNAVFIAPSILMVDAGNSFSTLGGITTFSKTGNATNDWNGGNTFGTLEVSNSGNGRLRLASVTGDTFISTSSFSNSGNNYLDIAFSGTNTFAESITINNSNPDGEIRFGELGGVSTLTTGGLLTTGFSAGFLLEINNFTQVHTIANGSFTVLNFVVNNSVFQGDFAVNTTNNLTFEASNTFNGTNSFISANQLNLDGPGIFSSPVGTSSSFVINGGGNEFWVGGNTFGTVTITNNTNSLLRMATTNGDTFLRNSTFNNTGTNFIDIAFNGSTSFAESITINNFNAGGSIRFGEGGGTSSLTTGGVLTSDFSVGNILEFNNFTQDQNVSNGSFGMNTFNTTNSSFQGDFQATANTIVNFIGSNTFARNTTFSGPSITADGGNAFASFGGVATFTKTGNANNTWAGGNIFGTFIFNNNSDGAVRLANATGDTYLSTSTFINTGNDYIDIAFNGTNTFAESITINNTNAAGIIRFGFGSGNSSLATGGLLTSDFSTGSLLQINNFTQVQNIANGSFTILDFTVNNSTFEGDFTVTTTDDLTIQSNNNFNGNNTFISADDLNIDGPNTFSTTSGTSTSFVKNGGPDDSWVGGNTFGTVSVTNNSNSYIRLANVNGDTFLGTSTFVNGGAGELEVSFRGTNLFAESITINNTNADGRITFGAANGVSTLNTGGLLTTDFALGALLEINNFTQIQNVSNGNFTVADFESVNSTFQGDIVVTTTDDIIFGNNNTFAGSNAFTSASGITMGTGNSFSASSGLSTFSKTGSDNNDWLGGNVFGDLVFTSSGTGRTRFSNGAPTGDTFSGNATFVRTGTGELDPVRNGTSTFSGNISTLGSTSQVTFGLGTGVVSIEGNTTQQIQGDGSFPPVIRRLSMNTSGSLQLAVPLSIAVSATFTNGVIQSNSTNLLTFENSSTSTGMSDGSHVNGPVRKVGNQAFTYPLGDGGYYSPLDMASRGGGGTDEYIAQYFQIAPVDIPTDTVSKDPTIGLMNQSEHWTLERTVGTVARGLSLSYNPARTSPIIDHTELVSIRYDGSAWRDIGGIVSGTAGGGTITASTTQAGVTLYSVASSFRILPVELFSIEANVIDSKEVLIEWITASEKDNSHFILEKSINGSDWETLALVPGAGDSQERKSYQVLDTNPRLGRQYYRLIQVDFDGDSEISQTIGVSLLGENGKSLALNVFPNPTQGKFTLESQNFNLDEMSLEILDLSGKPVIRTSELKNTRGVIDLSLQPKGIYILKLYSTKEVLIKKIILE